MHDRQAIKGPCFAFAAEFVRSLSRPQRGLTGDRYECVQLAVVRLDAVQQHLNQLDGLEIAVVEALRELRQGLRMQLDSAHSMTFGTR